MTLRTSVIIPTYNRAHLLPETIAAVLAQTRSVEEVLVINDGSTDGTAKAVARFGDAVRLVNRENAGKAAALNFALAQIKGELVWIVDDDDLPRPYAHETLAGMLEATPDATFAYGRHDRFRHSEKTGTSETLGTGYWGDDDPDRFLVSTLEDFFVHQPGMIVRLGAYDAAGPFDEALSASEDYDMLIRLAETGAPTSTPRVVFDQRVHGGARGRAGEEYAASQREEKWQAADQEIFHRVFERLSLKDYLTPERLKRPCWERGARLQRAVIFARRRMWEIALEDLDVAAFMDRTVPLDPDDVAALRRMGASKYGSEDLYADLQVRAGLGAVRKVSDVGAEITASIAHGLRWRVREAALHRKFGAAAGYARAWVSLR